MDGRLVVREKNQIRKDKKKKVCVYKKRVRIRNSGCQLERRITCAIFQGHVTPESQMN